MFLCVPEVYGGISALSRVTMISRKMQSYQETIGVSSIMQHGLTHLNGVFLLPFHAEADCKRWAVTLPGSPEDVSACKHCREPRQPSCRGDK